MVRAMESALVKPLMRGVSHQVSFFIAAIAGVWLLSHTQGTMFWACAVYLLTLCGQFAVSAAYHRPTWQPAARQWWRRADHAAIMCLIAGTATPIAMAIPQGKALLIFVWTGAALGVVRALFWINAPKWVAAVLALLLAWMMSPYLGDLRVALGVTSALLLLIGGLLYSLGALTYAFKRPDPWPATFGYHEVFHAFVVLAAACHFIVIARVVLHLNA
jgi:hemolysin III